MSKRNFADVKENIIINKAKLDSFCRGEERTYFEGCQMIGYMENGDSFLFHQSIGFEKGKDKRVIFAISRRLLEETLRDYPRLKK